MLRTAVGQQWFNPTDASRQDALVGKLLQARKRQVGIGMTVYPSVIAGGVRICA